MKPEKGAAAVEKVVTVDKSRFARRRHVERRASGPDPDYEEIREGDGLDWSCIFLAVSSCGCRCHLVLPPSSLGLPAGSELS